MHDFDLAFIGWIHQVDNVDQDVGFERLFKRSAERLDQAGGQALDEADRVGDQDRAATRQVDAAGRGVERGEEAVFGENAGAGECIEKAALAGVGVADQRRGEEAGFAPSGAAPGAASAYAVQPLVQHGHAAAVEAAVGFDLGLTGTAEGSNAAALPRELDPQF